MTARRNGVDLVRVADESGAVDEIERHLESPAEGRPRLFPASFEASGSPGNVAVTTASVRIARD